MYLLFSNKDWPVFSHSYNNYQHWSLYHLPFFVFHKKCDLKYSTNIEQFFNQIENKNLQKCFYLSAQMLNWAINLLATILRMAPNSKVFKLGRIMLFGGEKLIESIRAFCLYSKVESSWITTSNSFWEWLKYFLNGHLGAILK